MLQEVRTHVIRVRVAIDPAFAEWPFNRLYRLQVVFPDIGDKPTPYRVGLFLFEGEPRLSGDPLAHSAAGYVIHHMADLTILEK